MGKTEILNAKITNTRLGKEYEYFTAELTIEGNSWRCVFGGCCLDRWSGYSFADGYGAIIELMKTLEVEAWEELKGQYIRVEFEGAGCGKIVRIGHLMKDQWFSFKEYFENVNENREDLNDSN